MRRTTSMLALIGIAAGTAGCWDVELSLPVSTGVSVVEGNAILNKAHATLFGDLFQPFHFDQDQAGTRELSTFRLEAFYLQVTEEGLDSEEDLDDLGFLSTMDVVIRATDPGCGLPEITVATFDRDRDGGTPEELTFVVEPDQELLPYLQCGFELRSVAEGRIPADDVSIEGIALFVMTPDSNG